MKTSDSKDENVLENKEKELVEQIGKVKKLRAEWFEIITKTPEDEKQLHMKAEQLVFENIFTFEDFRDVLKIMLHTFIQRQNDVAAEKALNFFHSIEITAFLQHLFIDYNEGNEIGRPKGPIKISSDLYEV